MGMLIALTPNAARAAEEAQGTIRWPRPDYQMSPDKNVLSTPGSSCEPFPRHTNDIAPRSENVMSDVCIICRSNDWLPQKLRAVFV